MIRVVYYKNEEISSKQFDLYKSTIERICGVKMTFCYYSEINETTVYSGMRSLDSSIKVFVKLVDDEPVDLTVEDWNEQWNRFPQLIPDEFSDCSDCSDC
jgi:hypothetical protein